VGVIVVVVVGVWETVTHDIVGIPVLDWEAEPEVSVVDNEVDTRLEEIVTEAV
jgi:hypothetical protein